MPTVELQRLDPRAIIPRRMSTDAAGYDLSACLPEAETVVLAPGERGLVSTGWAMALPVGHEAQVRPRSGLALRQGLTVLNAPGTIDADYRGEIKVLLINLGQESVSIRHGDRIAQMVVSVVQSLDFEEVEALDAGTSPPRRGTGGFGSTG